MADHSHDHDQEGNTFMDTQAIREADLLQLFQTLSRDKDARAARLVDVMLKGVEEAFNNFMDKMLVELKDFSDPERYLVVVTALAELRHIERHITERGRELTGRDTNADVTTMVAEKKCHLFMTEAERVAYDEEQKQKLSALGFDLEKGVSENALSDLFKALGLGPQSKMAVLTPDKKEDEN